MGSASAAALQSGVQLRPSLGTRQMEERFKLIWTKKAETDQEPSQSPKDAERESEIQVANRPKIARDKRNDKAESIERQQGSHNRGNVLRMDTCRVRKWQPPAHLLPESSCANGASISNTCTSVRKMRRSRLWSRGLIAQGMWTDQKQCGCGRTVGY